MGPLADGPSTAPAPAFRLRSLLGLSLVALAAYGIWPRGHAAWKLHNLAVAHADYALCMAGPTGPKLFQQDPGAFTELVRRRLIASEPSDKPLSACEKLSGDIGVKHAAFRLHSAAAEEFEEYEGHPGARGRVSLQDLDLSLERLDDLAEQAWPFVRNGAAKLMRPSSHAKEAPFAPPPPAAGRGTGLPAARHRYRSTASFGDTIVVSLGSGANSRTMLSKNGGVDWERGGARLAEEVRDRCVADDDGRAFTLSRMSDGRRIVLSQGPSAAPQVATLGSPEEEVAGISCDESALVAAVVQPKNEKTGHHPVKLRLCPFQKPCKDMALPDTGTGGLYYPVDVARAGGDTILARTSGGITRVSSSRDDGRSWLPWTVAYDRTSDPHDAGAPFRLLVVGDRVLLYTGAQAGQSYPLLVSLDHGASFKAPELPNQVPAPILTTASSKMP